MKWEMKFESEIGQVIQEMPARGRSGGLGSESGAIGLNIYRKVQKFEMNCCKDIKFVTAGWHLTRIREQEIVTAEERKRRVEISK